MLDQASERFILGQYRRHHVLSLATVRPDGFPQATIVAFAYDGLTLYVAVDAGSQKARNIRRNGKVSAAIGHDTRDWSKVKALSLAGHARVLKRDQDVDRAIACLGARMPQMKTLGEAEGYEGWAFLEIKPLVVSLIDYTQGFGHTELVDLRK